MKLDTLREVKLWDDGFDFANISSKTRPTSLSIDRVRCHIDDPIKFINTAALGVWDLSDIAKAGRLLRRPKIPCEFENEHEMRRVYSLIYDVFRCKWIYVPQWVMSDNRKFNHLTGKWVTIRSPGTDCDVVDG